MKNTTQIILMLCIVGFVSPKAFAEDNSSNSFFPKNYVQDDSINQHDVTGENSNTRPLVTPTSSPQENSAFTELGNTPTPSASKPEIDLREGIPTESISLIVDATDYEELKKSIRIGGEFCLEHKIPFKNIYAVGLKYIPPDQFKMDYYGLLMAAAAQGATVESVDQIPSKYAVKNSPTWIINTLKGEVLLEGITELTPLFNSGNLFLGPQIEREQK